MTVSQLILLHLTTLCFGAIIGAYCGTIDYRIRENLPLITKDCFCPTCNHVLPGKDQIPILGWLMLGGKCRFCHTAIPKRYPIIEGGFSLFYLLSFVILHQKTAAMLILWLLFITSILVLRSKGHVASLLKGLGIMYIYHLLYGFLLYIIICA